jgi:ribosome biogenesis protein NSA1
MGMQALDGTQARMALGGEGCHVALWDLATQQQTWQAKGSKPNRAGLVDKPHITALACLPERTPPWVGAGREPCMLVGTAGHKLLLYDPGSGRRPQLELDWGDARVTAMTLARDGTLGRPGSRWGIP